MRRRVYTLVATLRCGCVRARNFVYGSPTRLDSTRLDSTRLDSTRLAGLLEQGVDRPSSPRVAYFHYARRTALSRGGAKGCWRQEGQHRCQTPPISPSLVVARLFPPTRCIFHRLISPSVTRACVSSPTPRAFRSLVFPFPLVLHSKCFPTLFLRPALSAVCFHPHPLSLSRNNRQSTRTHQLLRCSKFCFSFLFFLPHFRDEKCRRSRLLPRVHTQRATRGMKPVPEVGGRKEE